MFVVKAKVATLLEGDGLCTAAKFSPQGRWLAVVQGTVVLVFEVGDVGEPLVIRTSHVKGISDVCWSPDGQCIATASDDFTIEVTHLSYGPLHRLVGHTAPVVSVCFNDKGNLLFSSSMDESIKIWDVLNGAAMRTIAAHSEAVVSIDVPADDSSILCSGSYDGLIRVFDTGTGHCLKTLTYDKDWKSENGVVPISQVRCSRNGKFLLVKSLDGIVKLWDCVRGHVVRTFKVEPAQVRQLQHSCGMDILYPADGSPPIVVSGYEKGQLYCWSSLNKKLLQVIDGQQFRESPIMSIHCSDNLMCALALNGDCSIWEWSP
ncbi:hypothetical protein HG537_0F02870 [Torulaspora globosa]|uniref:Uncharacterized protein n=1 Tax=Torulaspora globosa TaxID=48254 RepID=A0A7H9HXF8_9SACH|nr:hypothetical protein HG537_0F02870 [Torulaspora sp. CBS 2947]